MATSLRDLPLWWARLVEFTADSIAAGAVTNSKLGTDAVTTAKIADDAVTTAELHETTIQYAEVAISSAEILALRATPKTLVAAPGAGKVAEFISAVLLLDATATAYTETADNMAIRYQNGTGPIVSQAIEATGFIDQTADTITVALPKIDPIAAKTAAENQPLVLHNTGDGEYATGTGTMRVKVAYRVHTTGF